MSLDKAIAHGKEHRKPFRKSKDFDPTCRNHGSCPWCYDNRKGRKERVSKDKIEDEMNEFRPWVPHNGDDGENLELYCSWCARDSKLRETGQGKYGCPIMAAAYQYDYDSRFFPHQYLSIRKDGSLVCEMFVMEDKE